MAQAVELKHSSGILAVTAHKGGAKLVHSVSSRPKHGPLSPKPMTGPPDPSKRHACVPCRMKKVGCDLRQPTVPYDPPCQRCRASNIRCYFDNDPRTSSSAITNPVPQEIPSISDRTCPHCSTVFLTEPDLRAHLRTQCMEKQYVCETCNARFRRLNDLDRHQRTHTGERPHKCDICGRTFNRGTTLTRHRQGPEGCAGRRTDLGWRSGGRQTTSESPQASHASPDLAHVRHSDQSDHSSDGRT